MNWTIVKAPLTSSQYGGDVYDITMISDKLEIAHSYIDPDNANFKQWQKIIYLVEEGCGIEITGVKFKTKNGQPATYKKTNERLVNADSKITITRAVEDLQDLLDELAAKLEKV